MKYTFPASSGATASASASATASASAEDTAESASLRELEHIHLLLEERLPIQEESQTEDSQS